MDGLRCMPRGRADGGAVSLMCWGWAFRTTASGVHLVTLKALTSPPPSICIFIHLRGPLRCCSPHSTITLPLLNIYGSQETRSQQQLVCSHTFFHRLSSSFHNFVFHGLPCRGGGFRDFFKVFTAHQDRSGSVGPVGKATVPSCGLVWSLQQRPESLKDEIFVVLNMLLADSASANDQVSNNTLLAKNIHVFKWKYTRFYVYYVVGTYRHAVKRKRHRKYSNLLRLWLLLIKSGIKKGCKYIYFKAITLK